MKEVMIIVIKSHYDQLVEDSDHLNKLKAAGVDNWGGYCGANSSDDETEEDIYG